MTAPDEERAARALEVVVGRVSQGRATEITDIAQCLGAGLERLDATGSSPTGWACDGG